MKRFSAQLALFAVLMVAIAVPAFAGAGHKCEAADAQACLNQMSAMKDKGWSGVEIDKSDMTAIKVKAVAPGSQGRDPGWRRAGGPERRKHHRHGSLEEGQG